MTSKKTFCDIVSFSTGNFPFLIHWFKHGYFHSKPGKAAIYLKKVALDLVKARRESGHTGKVCNDCHIQLYSMTLCSSLCIATYITRIINHVLTVCVIFVCFPGTTVLFRFCPCFGNEFVHAVLYV